MSVFFDAFAVFYKKCILPFPLPIFNADDSINVPEILTNLPMNLLMLTWFTLALYGLLTLLKRYLWLICMHERRRVLLELIRTPFKQ